MIVIVDYGMGNLASVANMLSKIGGACVISGDPAVIQAADKLILPGVGAFDRAMSKLNAANLLPVLNEKVLGQSTPVLGLCLGMQLMTEHSEEGNVPGLGWIKAKTKRFDFSHIATPDTLKIPHMGWNFVQKAKESPLFKYWENEMRFYFTHSYYVTDADPSIALLTANYGFKFLAGIEQGHIAGVQFHPEKSHYHGQLLLKAFIER